MTVPVGLPPRPRDGRAPASRGAARAPAFAAFSEDEHATRLARARTALRRAGFDGCVSVAQRFMSRPGVASIPTSPSGTFRSRSLRDATSNRGCLGV